MARVLARFRADPWKVRVSIRRDGQGWTATVAGKRSRRGRGHTVHDADPRACVLRALELAEANRMIGVDLGMQWSFQHPMGVVPEVRD